MLKKFGAVIAACTFTALISVPADASVGSAEQADVSPKALLVCSHPTFGTLNVREAPSTGSRVVRRIDGCGARTEYPALEGESYWCDEHRGGRTWMKAFDLNTNAYIGWFAEYCASIQ